MVTITNHPRQKWWTWVQGSSVATGENRAWQMMKGNVQECELDAARSNTSTGNAMQCGNFESRARKGRFWMKGDPMLVSVEMVTQGWVRKLFMLEEKTYWNLEAIHMLGSALMGLSEVNSGCNHAYMHMYTPLVWLLKVQLDTVCGWTGFTGLGWSGQHGGKRKDWSLHWKLINWLDKVIFCQQRQTMYELPQRGQPLTQVTCMSQKKGRQRLLSTRLRVSFILRNCQLHRQKPCFGYVTHSRELNGTNANAVGLICWTTYKYLIECPLFVRVEWSKSG